MQLQMQDDGFQVPKIQPPEGWTHLVGVEVGAGVDVDVRDVVEEVEVDVGVLLVDDLVVLVDD